MGSDDPRWDPEMKAARARMDAEAARHPPVVPEPPLDRHRKVNDALSMIWATDIPPMAFSADRWVYARGRRVLCRMHRPDARENLPVLIWFHGGGWVWASVDTHDKLVREYAGGAGIAAISVDYTLSPEVRFPVALEECAAVVRAVAAEAGEWGIDPARIVIGGDSAGGNLALATALALRGDGPKLAGVLAPYPVTSPDFASPSYVEFAEGYGLTRAAMMAYWNLYLRDESDRRNPLAAPLLGDLTGFPPTLIQLAELDVLRSEGEAMAARLKAAGADITLEAYPGVAHGFMRFTSGVAKSRAAVASAAAWLKRVTA